MSPAYSLYCGTRVRPEQLRLQHFGKADDRVERRAELVAHRREELRLGDVGLLGVAPRLVRHLARFLELVDERVLLGLVHHRLELGAVKLAGEEDEEDLGRDDDRGERVVDAARR